ncbi:MAG: uracil-DNA glycosylase family protein [Myxococcota bacterium]
MANPPSLALNILLDEVRRCRVCEAHLPLGPRPVVQLERGARIVIIGQAPGTKVHASGVPWDDASGDHLRSWLNLSRELFYDPRQIAIVPMGFCYPGRRKGGDAPPRPECAPLWHQRLLGFVAEDALLILAGRYAQDHYLSRGRKKTITETIRAYRTHGPRFFPVPHPAWRSKLWMKKHPWFEDEVLPELRRQVAERVHSTG